MKYLWLARFWSFFSEHLSDTIIALLVWKLTDSVLLAAMVIASSRISFWVFGLHAGYFADHSIKSRILKISTLLVSLAYILIALLQGVGQLTAILLGLLNFIVMSAKTFEFSAMNTLISGIKDTSEFRKNNIFIDSSKRWARILSPIMLLIALAFIDVSDMLIVVAICYCAVFVLYMKASYPEMTPVTAVNKPKLSLEIIRKSISKRLLAMFIIFGLYNLSYFSAIWIFLPYQFVSSNHESDFGWALLAFSFGGLVGNRFYKRFLVEKSAHQNLFTALAIVGVACFAFSVFNEYLLIIYLAAMIAGSGLPIMDMAMIEIIRGSVNAQHHGIAFSIFRFIADFGLILGGVIGGLMLQNLTIALSYSIMGFWIYLLLIAAYIINKRMMLS